MRARWTGRHAIALAQQGVAVVAVDQSPDMLDVAREKSARAGLDIDFRIGQSRGPLTGGRLTSSTSWSSALTLSHIPDIEHAVRECARVVRPGGSILISDIHPDVANGFWVGRPSFGDPVRRLACRSPVTRGRTISIQ